MYNKIDEIICMIYFITELWWDNESYPFFIYICGKN